MKYTAILSKFSYFLWKPFSRVRHQSHPGRGHGSLNCDMTQFERSDWLRSENFINIMIECAPIDLEAAATQWPVGSNWVFLLRVSPVRDRHRDWIKWSNITHFGTPIWFTMVDLFHVHYIAVKCSRSSVAGWGIVRCSSVAGLESVI